jgi:hypothetical protein
VSRSSGGLPYQERQAAALVQSSQPHGNLDDHWHHVLAEVLRPGHLFAVPVGRSISSELYDVALADDVVNRVRRAVLLDSEPFESEVQRLLNLAGVLDASINLNETAILRRVEEISTDLRAAVHGALRNVFLAEARRALPTVPASRQSDLAGDLHMHWCVRRGRVLDSWNPTRAGIHKYISLYLLPGAIPIALLREYEIAWYRAGTRSITTQPLRPNLEVESSEHGAKSVEDRLYIKHIRQLLEKNGTKIDETIALQAEGLSDEEIRLILGELSTRQIRDRRRSARRRIRRIVTESRDQGG